MKVSEAFLVNTKNFDKIIEALVNYEDREFVIDSSLLEMLGYSDPNDLLVVRLLKDLSIIDQDGEAGKYFDEFRDPETTKKALTRGVLDAYAPLFEKDPQIYKADIGDLKKAFNEVFNGKKTDLIVKYISGTFQKITNYCGAGTIEAVMDEREEAFETENESEAELAVANHSSNGMYHAGQNSSIDMDKNTEHDSDSGSANPYTSNNTDKPSRNNDIGTDRTSDFEDSSSYDDSEDQSEADFDPFETVDDEGEDFQEKEKKKQTQAVDNDPVELNTSLSEIDVKKTDDGPINTANDSDQENLVQQALIRKSELLHKLQRWDELIPTLNKIIQRFDNTEHSYLEDVVSQSIVRRAFVLVKLNRNDEALPALDNVINRFKNASDQQFYNHASVAMLHKAELLEHEENYSDLLPLYDSIIRRLSDNENEQIKGKVDRIFNKRYELVLDQGTQDEILQASEQLIDRFKNNTEYRNQLQKAMIKKAEILEETNRDEEALEAYDEFLAMFE
ncbi:DUF5343 domain-containing protein [Aliifodinibius salicampi]|uniref:DUF5343 domain-containing protein n=1 Tax=Fodinibius salicampi TaxID=1920655 RepID=A0ABT3PWW1_9BACT|nr:DUF5343 domain-containing protein [Fodinibius salicampi]MCW9712341.1 DUF5343 domain-containing protein [Fodinibius salicampi]